MGGERGPVGGWKGADQRLAWADVSQRDDEQERPFPDLHLHQPHVTRPVMHTAPTCAAQVRVRRG
jgi:hypothetical protein